MVQRLILFSLKLIVHMLYIGQSSLAELWRLCRTQPLAVVIDVTYENGLSGVVREGSDFRAATI